MTTLLMAAALVKFVTIDPGHFHASLVQNRTYPEVSPEVAVFAPDGIELENHLKLVEAFNTRKDSPTAWQEDVYRGDDYLAKFSAAAKDGKLGEKPVVILAGKNNRKGDYALAAVEAGCNVLSDKPMAITPEVFEKTEKAARLAQEKGLYFADIMTERCEITTILQHELAKFPLKRPEWYYDTKVQGEGIVDVTTHLVDIVQWTAFPGERLSKGDVEVMSASTWPTMISPEQFKMSTGGTIKEPLACESNGKFTWKLKGVSCKVSVVWNFMAPKGTGDTHYSLMRGTKAELLIRQGAAEGYRPVLYVKARGCAEETKKALASALAVVETKYPGVAAVATDEKGVWRITYPAKYDIGHEAHFSQVVRKFLGWMKAGQEDPDYIDNMIVKYYTIVEVWKKAQRKRDIVV